MTKPKTLIFDIETSYTVSATWGLYEQNVAKVLREPFIISIAWKWLGDKTVNCKTLIDFPLYKKDKFNDRELVGLIWQLFNEADIVIAHNGNGFDNKWCYGRFAVHNMKPPQPVKSVDTLLIARAKFKFNSNKLNDLGKYFNLGSKIENGGIDLWYNCIELADKKAWALMNKYNKQDVVLLEKVYLYILPYITNHPNLGLFVEEIHACPNCVSQNLQKRGYSYSRTSKAQRWLCNDCGAWSQSPFKDESQIR